MGEIKESFATLSQRIFLQYEEGYARHWIELELPRETNLQNYLIVPEKSLYIVLIN